jgi:hypothetical protein
MRFERPNAMTFASQASTGAFWNKLLTKLEAAIDDIQNQVTDLAAVQADLAAAQADIVAVQADQATQLAQILAAQAAAAAAAADAATAQSTATSAQGTADTVKASDAITASYVAPGLLLGGIDAGTDASIVVTNHTRHYGDSTTASLLSATITGLSYSTTYYVYYDDSSRTGGTVT